MITTIIIIIIIIIIVIIIIIIIIIIITIIIITIINVIIIIIIIIIITIVTVIVTKPTNNKSFIQEACMCSFYRAYATEQKLNKKKALKQRKFHTDRCVCCAN